MIGTLFKGLFKFAPLFSAMLFNKSMLRTCFYGSLVVALAVAAALWWYGFGIRLQIAGLVLTLVGALVSSLYIAGIKWHF